MADTRNGVGGQDKVPETQRNQSHGLYTVNLGHEEHPWGLNLPSVPYPAPLAWDEEGKRLSELEGGFEV